MTSSTAATARCPATFVQRQKTIPTHPNFVDAGICQRAHVNALRMTVFRGPLTPDVASDISKRCNSAPPALRRTYRRTRVWSCLTPRCLQSSERHDEAKTAPHFAASRMLLISGGACGEAADATDAAVGGGATTDSTSPSFSPTLLRNTCDRPRGEARPQCPSRLGPPPARSRSTSSERHSKRHSHAARAASTPVAVENALPASLACKLQHN